ncbi:MAG: hypothetical protein JWO89_3428, partial [Verrucomicrobiaceae bacterium]|nr:hypothetical protein [Verrucomicrobiaceae bacterium]
MSALILNRLRSDEWLPAHTTVALFGGIKGEPDLLPLIPWLLERQSTPVFFGFKGGLLIPQRIENSEQLERGIF